MDIDNVVGKLGEYGRFQVLIYIFCGIQGVAFQVWDILTVTSFLGPSSDFQCIVKEEGPDGSESYTTYNNSVNRGACEDGVLIFDLETYGRTMVTEWELVGDKAMLIKLSQSIFMGSLMLGAIFFGHISDKFGRKPCFAFSSSITAFLGLATGLAPNIWVFMILRGLSGFFGPGYTCVAFILALEVFPPKTRTAAGIIAGAFNVLGFVPLAVLAHLIRDWRYLQITTSTFRCVMLPFLLLMPESFQWLAAKGKYDEVEKLLQRIAKFNGQDIPFPILPVTTKAPTDEPPAQDEGTIEGNSAKEKEGSMEKLFMYDSALSLDRDYIPPEDTASLQAYSSESETEETPQTTASLYSIRRDISMRNNLPHVNSSISILSELRQEQCELSYSVRSLLGAPSETPIIVPVNKPLRKKSVSLCQLPIIAARDAPTELHNNLDSKTVSFPHLNTAELASGQEVLTVAAESRNTGRSKPVRKPGLLSIPPVEGHGSAFWVSIPALTIPFLSSQNLAPSVDYRYQDVECQQAVSASEGEDTSGSDVPPVSGYETLEEGYYTELSQTNAYSEPPVFFETEGHLEKEAVESQKTFTWLDLFRRSSVRQVIISCMFLWFAAYVVYIGLSMGTDALVGDPYINFSLVGLVEIPAVVIAVLSAVRIGRRFPIGILNILMILSCCVYLVLSTVESTAVTAMVSLVAILLAKTFISASYFILCLLTAEILPTSLRATGLGFCTLCARLGGVVAPMILIAGETWSMLPLLIFCSLLLVSCLALLPLPEMINMPQPRTPDDIKKIRRVSRERKFSTARPPPEAFV